MSAHFTGRWELNHEETKSQKDLLSKMGRPKWQINVVDGADENYTIFELMSLSKSNQEIYKFDITVKIFLNNGFLKLFSPIIPFSTVKYKHQMVAHKKEVKHPNDKKDFGDCTSRTEWIKDAKNPTFIVRWYLKKGILKVIHTIYKHETDIMKDVFTTDLQFTTIDGKVAKSKKVFKRIKLRPKDLKYIRKTKHFKYVKGLTSDI
jgi:hypothetical protein